MIFENDWFVYLQAQGGSASIAFLSTAHPSAPPGPEPFVSGMSLELEVADAAAALAQLHASRDPDYPLISLRDPSGLWINIVQQLG